MNGINSSWLKAQITIQIKGIEPGQKAKEIADIENIITDQRQTAIESERRATCITHTVSITGLGATASAFFNFASLTRVALGIAGIALLIFSTFARRVYYHYRSRTDLDNPDALAKMRWRIEHVDNKADALLNACTTEEGVDVARIARYELLSIPSTTDYYSRYWICTRLIHIANTAKQSDADSYPTICHKISKHMEKHVFCSEIQIN